MIKSVWVVLAFLAGAFLPLQAGLNTKLSRVGGNPVYASTISFIIGSLGLMLYILITRQTVSWAGLRAAPAYAWLGGLLGAFYVSVIVLAFPKLGPGLTFGLVVAGQVIFATLLEHFNVLVAQQHPISYPRMLGILLIVAGVFLIQKF